MTRPLPSLLAVLGVLAVVSVLAGLVSPADGRPASQGVQKRVPVTQASVVCPDPRESGDDFGVDVHAVTPPSDVSGLPSGEATVASLRPDGEEALTTVESRGRVQTETKEKGDASALTVRATGSLAPGLAAEEHSLVDTGDARGLAAQTCPDPGTDAWFVGGGSEVGQRTTVLLTNSEPSPAQVDVTVYGPDGPLDAPGGRGVVVGARQQESLRLDALAPGAEVTAVHVEVRTGQVASSVFDTEVEGLTARGTEWVPQAGSPEKRLVVPGFVEGEGTRRLHLLAPGPNAAVVQLEVITPERAFVPSEKEVVDVPAGEVTSVDLTKVLDTAPAAVRLTSDVPVVAGAESRTGAESGTSEVAWSAATEPLTGPTATLGNAAGGGVTSALQLTAPRGDAKVSVQTLTSDGEGESRTVEVPGGSTQRVTLEGPGEFGAAVTPAEGSGPVHAARVLVREGGSAPYVTVQPLQESTTTVEVPEVASDLSTGLYG